MTKALDTDIVQVLERLALNTELIVYAIILLGALTFLGLVATLVGNYGARVQHREAMQVLKEIRSASDRLGYYLFKKLGPVELP